MGFKFDYVDENEHEKRKQKSIQELKVSQKSDFIFNGEDLYELGNGHNFVYGFFVEYITKNGVEAYSYVSGLWSIGSDFFKFKDNKFIKEPLAETKDIDWNKLTFPKVKNISAKTIANDLKPEKPMG